MSDKLNFNDLILRLLAYWKEQNCLVWQPYNVQVGAGTMNPATVLRVLGPEPWNVAYIEPSIRPDDGRFGDNPNRMQQHYQLQVILKPDPGNPQELYLRSLQAIGIDPLQHDIRFVEDNWESPALGAWGLGWEVWLDGQEITQFTYFQQAGGQNLDPVSVEITYGLDRIALALQGVDSVWALDYGAGVAYGEALLQAEIEHCNYYFNGADVEALAQVYETYETEAKRCIQAGLIMPAHDYNLKCSHLFNVLDTRGAIGVTERANYFKRMRGIARDISALYAAQREELGYPLLQNMTWAKPTPKLDMPAFNSSSSEPALPFLLEIGSEELPATDLNSALNQLKSLLPELLTDMRLSYNDIEYGATPRRLAAMVDGLATRQADLQFEAKGPPADRAFDADGKPTKAAEGFARSRGVAVEALRIVKEGDRRYVAADVEEKGRLAGELLAERLPELIAGIKFEKSMRWNETNTAYSRPIRWFVTMLGADVVPFVYAGIPSGDISRGLRPYGSPPIQISAADGYADQMKANQIWIDIDVRKTQIAAQAQTLAASVGGIAPDEPALLDEINNLIESPTPLLGKFEEKHLTLPAEVLAAVMKKHQRYLPVYSPSGGLLPYFIAVRNGDDQYLDSVRHGNEQVIRARFADAEFFYDRDIQKPLEQYLPDLKTLTFQAKLGSMYDKVERLTQLIPRIAAALNLSHADREYARRAAALSKADLATNFVVEMTSLQGVLGGHYAQRDGEPPEVAAAIAEQYETVSGSQPSLALALADRLDSLTGLFSVGLAPKGSNDPFALRRAAIQIIENLIVNEVDFDLRPAIQAADELLPAGADAANQQNVMAFIAGRLEGALRERGFSSHTIKAVLAAQSGNPFRASQACAALDQAQQADDWEKLLDAYARCARITRDLDSAYPLDESALTLPAEKTLATALNRAQSAQDGTIEGFVSSLRQMEPAITHFFDEVLVMDKDEAARNNRLALLQTIAGIPHRLADLSQLAGF